MIFQKKLDDSMRKLYESSDRYQEEIKSRQMPGDEEKAEDGEERHFKTLEQYREESEVDRVRLEGKDWIALFLSAYATLFLTGFAVLGALAAIVWFLLLR